MVSINLNGLTSEEVRDIVSILDHCSFIVSFSDTEWSLEGSVSKSQLIGILNIIEGSDGA